MTPPWLLAAYASGIFPWFDDDRGPVLWWSPDPRAVLVPEQIHLRRSLRKRLRNGGFQLTADQAFDDVVARCSEPRADATGTWITDRMRLAYGELHRLCIAHSLEVWLDGDLVGGLYGVQIGRLFCGESMFSRAPDASKVAFAALALGIAPGRFELIDCQMPTDHLASLGVETRSRAQFLQDLPPLTGAPGSPQRWPLHIAASTLPVSSSRAAL